MMMTKTYSSRVWNLLHEKLFYSRSATGLTVVAGFLFSIIAFYLYSWGIADAVFRPDAEACHAASGACWGFVAEKWRLIIFGRFPYEMQWRPAVAVLSIIAMLVATACPRLWTRQGAKWIFGGWVAAFAIFFTLMYGGVLGLARVDTDGWGGFPLTVILTLLGMTLSIPIGIVLALGRRSKLPIIRCLSVGYIELVRGVPLITVLFVASFVFPLWLPADVRIDPFWRVAWGIILFQSAYMAETVRGGLQTIAKGQFLAADSLGLSYTQKYCHVILPQALVAIIPAFVNSLLSTFMDTSLVTVVSMFDLTGSLSLALGDATWRDFFREGYIFVAAIYFFFSFLMSRYSQWLERHLQGNKQRGR